MKLFTWKNIKDRLKNADQINSRHIKTSEEIFMVLFIVYIETINNTILTYLFIYLFIFFFFLWRCDPTRVMASSFLRFLDHTQWRITVGRTPLDEWSAHRRDLYLTAQNTHNRQTSMPPVGFEPMISAGERPQTYTLDRVGSGTGYIFK